MSDNAGSAAQRLAADPPQWLTVLGTPALGGDLGIRRFGPPEWEEVEDPADYPVNTMLTDQLEAADCAVREGKVLVAQGPANSRRFPLFPGDVQWYADPAEPGLLWCALGYFCPGWLWVPVTPQSDALAELLGGMFPRPALKMADFTRHERGFVGNLDDLSLPNMRTGDPVAFSGPNLDRYFSRVPFVDGDSWGSAHDDDPAPERDGGSILQGMGTGKSSPYSQQMLGRVPSKTWRAMHSGSYMSLEIHGRTLVCVRLSYRPAPASHQAVVARCNADFGLDLPADLPLDVVGALTCFPYNTEADIIHNITRPDSPDQLAGGLRAVAALAEGDLEKMMMLRQYASHPDRAVRLSVLKIANSYNLPFLLEEIALASEGDADILETVDYLIERDIRPDNQNMFRDHLPGPVFVGEDGHTDPGEWPGGEQDKDQADE